VQKSNSTDGDNKRFKAKINLSLKKKALPKKLLFFLLAQVFFFSKKEKVFLHFSICTLHFALNCSKSTRF
jgi:hypothetical protein